jgi:hypothetical protein
MRGACASCTARPAGPAWTPIEVDLLAAGLLQRVATRARRQLREALRLSDAGIAALALAQQRNRAAFDRTKRWWRWWCARCSAAGAPPSPAEPARAGG